jgi:hypothetical protein
VTGALAAAAVGCGACWPLLSPATATTVDEGALELLLLVPLLLLLTTVVDEAGPVDGATVAVDRTPPDGAPVGWPFPLILP